MDKSEAISIINQCAPLYAALSKKDYIFIFTKDRQKAEFVEISFPENNFYHLTGVSYSGNPSSFFRAAIDNRLNENTISFKNGTTTLKLEVLKSLVKLPESARWIGGFDGSGVRLHTDILAGNICGCMGFIQMKNSKRLIPNTALKGDIRQLVLQPVGEIIATISKQKKEFIYSFPQHINSKVDRNALLFSLDLIEKLDAGILSAL